MILTFHEGACVRAQAGDTTLVFSPVSKKSKNFKAANFGADVAFVSLNDADMNGAEEASRGDKKPFVIFGPGEYEVKEITAAGFPTKSLYGGSYSAEASKDKQERINTVYALTFDDMSVLYLGALDVSDLPKEVFEMDSPDILITPIGGDGTLTPAEAAKLAVKLEPKIIIPILYDDKTLKQFLKEAGDEGSKPMEKFTVKLRDLADKEGDVVVLQS